MKVLDFFLMLMLAATSADLLYLYYNNAWYDPNIVIEIIEVVLTFVFLILAMTRAFFLGKRIVQCK